VNLGAGGLVRAYTDCIAHALLGAEKTPIVRLVTLRCALPYALEGMARRDLQAAGGTLGQVQHSAQVEITFTLPEPAAASLVAKLNEACHGQMRWLEVDEAV
jgi:putative IMPACT (imprinted ancient) family translation regulator